MTKLAKVPYFFSFKNLIAATMIADARKNLIAVAYVGKINGIAIDNI